MRVIKFCIQRRGDFYGLEKIRFRLLKVWYQRADSLKKVLTVFRGEKTAIL
jgi:hypothetical protein